MAGGKTTWESSEEGELDTTYKFTSGTWATLSGAYRGQWSTGGGNQTDAIRMVVEIQDIQTMQQHGEDHHGQI